MIQLNPSQQDTVPEIVLTLRHTVRPRCIRIDICEM